MTNHMVMVSNSPYPDDVRVDRAARTAAADGWDVTVVAQAGSHPPPDGIRLAAVGERRAPGERRLPDPQQGPWRAVRWLGLPEHRSRVERRFSRSVRGAADSFAPPDLVHAHDFPALGVAAELAAGSGAKLVYDSHELWSGRRLEGRPAPLQRRRRLAEERRLGVRADVVVTVSDELAERLGAILGRTDIRLVRNTFPVESTDLPQQPAAIVYVGRISRGRDLETAFASELLSSRGVALVVMGPAGGIDVPGWVDLRLPVPAAEVGGVMATAGLALISLDDSCANHRVALPNKLFQAVAAGVPVVAAELPAMRRLVTAFDLGELYAPGDPRSLDRAITAATARYAELCVSVLAAQPKLNWDVDAAELRSLYRELAS